MPASDWTRSEDWDVLYLGGQRLPGVARVDVKLPSGLDVQKPRGGKKASIKDSGAQPARLSVQLEMLPEDLDEWDRVLSSKIRPAQANAGQKKLEIAHPQARMYGVNMVRVGDISAPMPRSGGTYVVRMELLEHVDAPKAVKRETKKTAEGDWDVQPRIDALKERPSQNGAAEQNFSSPDQEAGNGSTGDFTPPDGPILWSGG